MSATTLAPRAFLTDAARPIFVSSTVGDDHNAGRSRNAPLASLGAALKQIADGRGREIRLRRGETFPVAIRRILMNGSIRIGTYGYGLRPRLAFDGNAMRFEAAHENVGLSISGIDFVLQDTSEERGPSSRVPMGVGVRGGMRKVAIDDCRFLGFQTGLEIRDAANLELRRCIFGDHAIAAAIDRVTQCRIDQCVFDAGDATCQGIRPLDRIDGLRPRGLGNLVVHDCIFNGFIGAALDAEACDMSVDLCLFLSNAVHAVVAGGDSQLTTNVFLGGNNGNGSAGVIARSREAMLLRNIFAQRHRNPGPAVFVDPSCDGAIAHLSQNLVRAWEAGCASIGRGLCVADHNDFELADSESAFISIAASGATFAGLKNAYRNSIALNPAAFRKGRASFCFDRWRQLLDDHASAMLPVGDPIHIHLPSRLVADARTQAFTAWRAALNASLLCRRVRDEICKSSVNPDPIWSLP